MEDKKALTCLLSFMVGIPQHSVKREGGREGRRKQLSLSAQFYDGDSAAQNKEIKEGREGRKHSHPFAQYYGGDSAAQNKEREGGRKSLSPLCSVSWWEFRSEAALPPCRSSRTPSLCVQPG